MKSKLPFSIALAVGLALVMVVGATTAAATNSTSKTHGKRVLVEGSALVGGPNGIFFDHENNLVAAQVLGHGISTINPETGKILETLGPADQVLFPDDVTVGADGTVYWTEIALGTAFRRAPGGPSEQLLPFGALPSANPLTLSDDGKRLFVAGCYNADPAVGNGIFEIDLATVISSPDTAVRVILNGYPGCASNAMDYVRDGKGDEWLVGPRPFEDKVVRINIATGVATDVSTGWSAPIAVKFNSRRELYAASQGIGEIVKIDLNEPDKTANRTVVGTQPRAAIDNIAFDKNDRLYVSSDGGILEILRGGKIRTVIPGGLPLALGVAVARDTVYTINFGAVHGFNSKTGRETSITRSVFGIDPIPPSTNIVAWGKHLALISGFTGAVTIWDPATETVVSSSLFGLPNDAAPYQGGLVITESATGDVVHATGKDLADRKILAKGLMNPTGVAVTHDDVYVSEAGTGNVLQVVADGKVLDPPAVIASGLAIPEGLALYRANTRLLIADGGTNTLEEVYLHSGSRRTIASDLGFSAPIPFVAPIGWFNNVDVDRRGHIFVNGDGANVIWKIKRGHRNHVAKRVHAEKGHYAHRGHKHSTSKYDARRHRNSW